MSAPPIHAHADGATCFSVLGILFHLRAGQFTTMPAGYGFIMTFTFEQFLPALHLTVFRISDFPIEHSFRRKGQSQSLAKVRERVSCVRPFWMTASERNPSYFSSKIHSGCSKGSGLRDNGMGWNAIAIAYWSRWRKVGEVSHATSVLNSI